MLTADGRPAILHNNNGVFGDFAQRVPDFFTVVFSAGSSFDLWFVGKVKYDPTAATTESHGVN